MFLLLFHFSLMYSHLFFSFPFPFKVLLNSSSISFYFFSAFHSLYSITNFLHFFFPFQSFHFCVFQNFRSTILHFYSYKQMQRFVQSTRSSRWISNISSHHAIHAFLIAFLFFLLIWLTVERSQEASTFYFTKDNKL